MFKLSIFWVGPYHFQLFHFKWQMQGFYLLAFIVSTKFCMAQCNIKSEDLSNCLAKTDFHNNRLCGEERMRPVTSVVCKELARCLLLVYVSDIIFNIGSSGSSGRRGSSGSSGSSGSRGSCLAHLGSL